MSNLFALSKTFDINPNKHIIMAGDFNLFFNSKLDAAAGIPSLKRNSLAKLIELKEAYDKLLVLFNADLITFLSQTVFKNLHPLQILWLLFQQIIPPVLFSLSQEKANIRSKGFWKFNSSLIKDKSCKYEIKDLIRNFDTKNDGDFSRQLT